MDGYFEKLQRAIAFMDSQREGDFQTLVQILTRILAQNGGNPYTAIESELENHGIDTITIEALFDSLRSFRKHVQKVHVFQSKILGRTRPNEWDVLLPLPQEKYSSACRFSFEEAREILIAAFTEYNPEWGKFVKTMFTMNRIEKSGTYNCCRIDDAFEYPAIEVTFMEDVTGVIGLAHELGHGCEYYVQKQKNNVPYTLPPMVFWEIMSNYCEFVVREYLLRTKPELTPVILWNATYVIDFLLCPLNFERNRELIIMAQSRMPSIDDVETLDARKIKEWFGIDLLEKRPRFWQNMINHGWQSLFYNYNQTVGRLLAHNLLSHSDIDINKFIVSYKTHNLTQLIERFWGSSPHDPEFWYTCLMPVKADIEQLLTCNFSAI